MYAVQNGHEPILPCCTHTFSVYLHDQGRRLSKLCFIVTAPALWNTVQLSIHKYDVKTFLFQRELVSHSNESNLNIINLF